MDRSYPGAPVRFHRTLPVGKQSIALTALFEMTPLTEAMLSSGASRVRARDAAQTLLSPLFSNALPTQALFAALLRWAPLIERNAYLVALRLTAYLAALRTAIPSLTNAEARVMRIRCWTMATKIGRLMLLASGREAGSWLLPMAKRQVWEQWTPSLPLTRERSLWLALIGARLAAATGEMVIDNYLAALARSRHPRIAYDALLESES